MSAPRVRVIVADDLFWVVRGRPARRIAGPWRSAHDASEAPRALNELARELEATP